MLTARGLDPSDAIKAAHVFFEMYGDAFRILSNPEDYDRIIGGDDELKHRVLTDPVMHALFVVARRLYNEVQHQRVDPRLRESFAEGAGWFGPEPADEPTQRRYIDQPRSTA